MTEQPRTHRNGAHVLAGFDGSAPSVRALRWAAAEAERRGIALEIVACYSGPPAVGIWAVPCDLDALRDEIVADVTAAVGALRAAHPRLAVTGRVVLGRPGEELLTESKAADLLVVGTSGAGAVESLVLGSVAFTVARHAACPVVLVPDADPPGFDHPQDRPLVVAGYDGSDAAGAALDWAVAYTDRIGGELLVVHAWRDRYRAAIDDQEAHDFRRVDAAIDLDIGLERARATAQGHVRGTVVEARPADAILDAAQRADLVVVGSRGRGAVRTTLFGSVALDVVQRARCPVAVVRHPEVAR